MDTPSQRRRIAVFLLQLGGPKTLADIEPFLKNLFEDVLPVPRLVRPMVARMVARRRAPKVAPQYRLMGGGSPLLANTEAQAGALESELERRGWNAKVLVTMRFAPPRALTALAEAQRDWADATWVALPLYPQYSFATTRSSLDELQALLTAAEQTRLQIVQAYPKEPGYVEALAAAVDEAVARVPAELHSAAHVVFSAHGLPLRLVRQGDPYPEQVRDTVAATMAKVRAVLPHTLAFQSRVGPVKWLEPSVIDMVSALGKGGTKALVVVPVSFVSDHIETLVELDIDLRETAKQAGVVHFERAATPGVRSPFIGGLAGLVERAVEQVS
jgi:protoporphyrin/coproporphyrin ferrochelatase